MTWSSVLLVLSLSAQAPPAEPTETTPEKIKVSTPTVLKKMEPAYTDEGRNARVQGKVFIGLVVDADGKPRDIEVISPLGYGLDEAAVRAVEQWRFRPGMRLGEPVAVFANIEVSFRMDIDNDWKTEELRTEYNRALSTWRKTGKWPPNTGKVVADLAKRKHPDGMFLHGVALRDGTYGETNVPLGLQLIEDSAKKGHGGALYLIGVAHYRGLWQKPLDVAKAIDLWKRASLNGSPEAQIALAGLHEKGQGVALDLDRARQLYLICAARGIPKCQSRYGSLTLAKPGRSDYELVRAVAWLELAAEGGESGGDKQLAEARAQLPENLAKNVAEIKPRLVQK